MSTEHIRNSMEGVIEYLGQHPDEARGTDKAAKAVIEEGLRCRIEGPGGAVVFSDMVPAVGGGGTAPPPGWYSRAALACCDATMVAMRAAQEGVNLSTLEVTVDSQSDDRGMLGMDDAIPAGPLSVRIHIRLGAEGVSAEHLHEIIEWVEAHSPVGDAIRRAVPSTVEIEIV